MHFSRRPEILSQHHCHIHMARRVGCAPNNSDTERARHRAGAAVVPATHQQRGAGRGIGVVIADDVNSVGTKEARRDASEAAMVGAIHDFDDGGLLAIRN
jgi:hypothetical protein